MEFFVLTIVSQLTLQDAGTNLVIIKPHQSLKVLREIFSEQDCNCTTREQNTAWTWVSYGWSGRIYRLMPGSSLRYRSTEHSLWPLCSNVRSRHFWSRRAQESLQRRRTRSRPDRVAHLTSPLPRRDQRCLPFWKTSENMEWQKTCTCATQSYMLCLQCGDNGFSACITEPFVGRRVCFCVTCHVPAPGDGVFTDLTVEALVPGKTEARVTADSVFAMSAMSTGQWLAGVAICRTTNKLNELQLN